jgi:hypothetical protein
MHGLYNILQGIGRQFSRSFSGFAQTAIKFTGTGKFYTGTPKTFTETPTAFTGMGNTAPHTPNFSAGTPKISTGFGKTSTGTPKTSTGFGKGITRTDNSSPQPGLPLFLTKNQLKTMKKDFIPDADAQFDSWEENFVTKLATHAAALGYTAAEVDAIVAEITGHRGKYTTAQAAKAAAKSAVDDARATRKTTEKDIRTFVKNLKTRPGYTTGIGNDLGVIGPNETVDWDTVKPTLKAVLDGDRIRIDWNKGQADGVIIFSKRLNFDGQFNPIGIDLEPPFYDDRDNANQGQPETREYYAIYLVKDQQRGLRSDTISIAVQGQQ